MNDFRPFIPSCLKNAEVDVKSEHGGSGRVTSLFPSVASSQSRSRVLGTHRLQLMPDSVRG